MLSCFPVQAKGVPLASNQVQYSLLYRVPEVNGVADAVREAGATLVAYSPLAQGLLTGAWSPSTASYCGPRQETCHRNLLFV